MQSFYLWERELKSNLDNNRYHCDPAPVGAQVGLIIIQNNEIKAFVVKNYSMVRHLWERYIGCLPPIIKIKITSRFGDCMSSVQSLPPIANSVDEIWVLKPQ